MQLEASIPHVIKIGGSLLSRPDARTAIGVWLEASKRANEHQVLIVGGGEAVEWLRRLDRHNPLGKVAAHWSAIAMMNANAIALSQWWRGIALVDDWADLQIRVNKPGASLFAAQRFLQRDEPKSPGLSLPAGWQVTSDSIAARIAILLGGRLTLLKSQEFQTPTSVEEWKDLAKQGIVDTFLPRLAGKLGSISIANVGQAPPAGAATQ